MATVSLIILPRPLISYIMENLVFVDEGVKPVHMLVKLSCLITAAHKPLTATETNQSQ